MIPYFIKGTQAGLPEIQMKRAKKFRSITGCDLPRPCRRGIHLPRRLSPDFGTAPAGIGNHPRLKFFMQTILPLVNHPSFASTSASPCGSMRKAWKKSPPQDR
jgi:hypothetical protein